MEANSGDVSIGHTLPSPLHSRGISCITQLAKLALSGLLATFFTSWGLHSASPIDIISPDSYHLCPLYSTPVMLKAGGRMRYVRNTGYKIKSDSLSSGHASSVFFVPWVPFNASSSISFSQEVQTVGARFTKHKPELLEHVVQSQQLWVLRFTNGTRD